MQLEAYFCLDRLRIPEAFGSWLRRIVLKQCDRIARRAQLSTTPLDETMADDLASTPEDVLDVLEHARKVRAVRDAIDALPELERVVTVMFYVSEMPQKEIAEFLEVPVFDREESTLLGSQSIASRDDSGRCRESLRSDAFHGGLRGGAHTSHSGSPAASEPGSESGVRDAASGAKWTRLGNRSNTWEAQLTPQQFSVSQGSARESALRARF